MPANNQDPRPLALDGTGTGTGPASDSTNAVTEAPGLTFLITTDPREAKSAATRKRVRQAAALKSWRDIKGEAASSAASTSASASALGPAPKRSKTAISAAAGAEPSRKRARRRASAATQSITWEGVPASQYQHQQHQHQHQGTAVFLPARPPNLAAASASASASSSGSTHTLSSLSSSISNPPPFIHPQPHESQNDTPLDTIVLSAGSSLSLHSPFLPSPNQSHAQITPLQPSSSDSSLVTSPAATTDDALRVSFRHTIGWPADAAGQISTSPKLPSISEIIEHQELCSRRNSFRANLTQAARDEASAVDDLPSPCHVYCNELDPYNCCPVKHKSWFDGVLHHMLTVFAPRAWPALKITNEQGLRWEHFMTQHAFSEPALYYVRLLFATGDMVALNVANPQLRLWLQSRAIESINDALADPSRATSDALILAIGRIALNESLYGDKLAAHTLHRPAQQRMIALRGGIDALEFPPLVKRLMRWSDKVMSMQGGTPRMIPDDAEPHYTDATSVEVLEKWSPREGMALRKKSQLQKAE